jgi:outer membrane lipoprotein-sorting protein
MDRASGDALATHSAFDLYTYRKALANQSALYAGEDDIEGDLCYVVAVPSFFPEEAGSDTSYYWISARTGTPRSKQKYRILRGKTSVTYRWVISNIRLNPTLPPEAFSYHPTLTDSSVPLDRGPAVQANASAFRDRTGQPVSRGKTDTGY